MGSMALYFARWPRKLYLAPSRRSDVQCLHRWQKVLRPGLVKGPWTKEEDETIIRCIKAGITKVCMHLPLSYPGMIWIHPVCSGLRLQKPFQGVLGSSAGNVGSTTLTPALRRGDGARRRTMH